MLRPQRSSRGRGTRDSDRREGRGVTDEGGACSATAGSFRPGSWCGPPARRRTRCSPICRARSIADASSSTTTLAVPGWPGVWALGDCAVIPDRRDRPAVSADRAARASARPRTLARNIAATLAGGRRALRFPHYRPARGDRHAARASPACSASTSRVRRLVAMADDLSEQAAATREEVPRRARLDARPALRQGLRPVPDRPRAGDVDARAPSRRDVSAMR